MQMGDFRSGNKIRGRGWLATAILLGTCLIGAKPGAAQQNPIPCPFPAFTELPAELTGVEDASVAWGDYDNDGDLDLAVAGVSASNYFADLYIYRNDGVGGFVKQVSFSDVDEAGKLTWGDYNNDGHLDLLAIRTIYRNNGDGSFTDHYLGYEYTLQPSGAWGDYDNDGDLDLLLANFDSTRIYRNDGDFVFIDIEAPLPVCSRGSAEWGDYDNDGDLDILLTGDSGQVDITRIYRNDGGGTFTDINAALPGARGSCATWGDYDNDGDLDILLTGNSDAGRFAGVFRNDGQDLFTQIQTDLVPVSFGTAAWGDYDNDGNLDILLAGSTGVNQGNARIYRNDGDGVFTDIGELLEGATFGAAAWGDYDNDGDLDIAMAGLSFPDFTGLTQIYTNNACVANTPPLAPFSGDVTVDEEGRATFDLGFGSDLETPTAGLNYNLRVGTAPGLDDVKTPMADAVSGHRRIAARGNVDNTRLYTIHGLTPGQTYYWSVQAIDTAFAGSPYTQEQSFTVPLPPCTISCPRDINIALEDPCTTGVMVEYPPAETQGDCLGDLVYSQASGTYFPIGQTEVTVASADGLTSCSFLVNVNVAPMFTEAPTQLVGLAYSSLAWGDYDNDGDLDLVTIGLVEELALDRQIILYQNNGSGNFIQKASWISINAGPPNQKKIDWGDYDNDGDLDIVSGLSIYQNLGGSSFTEILIGTDNDENLSAWGDCDNDGDLDLLLTNSGGTWLYRNDGNSVFTKLATSLPPTSYGSVEWGDCNNDGRLDILLAGYNSSGSVCRVYRNTGGFTFSDMQLQFPDLWWPRATWGDYDNDGDLDILLTEGSASTSSNPFTGLFRNDGISGFTQVQTNLTQIAGQGAWGDYDNDGDMDILLAGLTGPSQPVSMVYRNEGNSIFVDIGAQLSGLYHIGAAAWGDQDNDGDLDIAMTGTSNNVPIMTKIYNNNTCDANTPPNPPLLGSATVSGTSAQFSWEYGSDSQTPYQVLTNNLRVGTAPGLSDVVGPMADMSSGYRRIVARGNAGTLQTYTLNGLELGQTYYWSVQAIDTAFAGSPFALEQSFTVSEPCSIACPRNIDVSVDDPCTTGIMVEYPPAETRGDCLGELVYSQASGTYFPIGQTVVTVASADGLTSCSFMVNVNVSPMFVDIEKRLIGVEDGSVDWGDYDGDGDQDLVIAGWDQIGDGRSTTIYRNDNGTFTDIRANLIGAHHGSVDWGDYDADGDLDLLLTGMTDNFDARVYRNDGNDTFTDIVAGLPGLYRSSGQWGDYDNDGDLDILLTGSASSDITRIYENQDGTFVDIQAGLTRISQGLALWGDLDGDDDLDILLSGGVGTAVTTIYLNMGNNTFVEPNNTLTDLTYSGADLGDYDNDGDLDILIAGLAREGDTYYPLSLIYRNDDGNFTDIQAGLTGLYEGSADWGDYDNDGDLDILLTGAITDSQSQVPPEYHTLVYRNDGGSFTELEMTGLPGLANHAYAAWGDINGDGKLEIALTGSDGPNGDQISRIYALNVCPPCEFTCPADITVDAATGTCGAVVQYPDIQKSDNCGDLLFDPPSGYEFPVGDTTVTVMTGDAQTSCSFTVTVNDIDPPIIECPADMVINAAADQCSAVVNFQVQASDECGTVTVESNPPSGTMLPIGRFVVNSTATDSNGNQARCSFTVTVRDVTPPTLACPQDFNVNAAPGECGAEVNFEFTAFDGCTQIPQIVVPRADVSPGVIIETSHESGSIFPVGVTDVITTATDMAGNFTTCSFSVTVQDAQPPTIECPSDIDVLVDEGTSSKTISFDLFASDNCGPANVYSVPASGSTFPVGQTEVFVTATDAASNNTTCTFTVTVRDAAAPTVTCPVDIVVDNETDQCSAVVDFNITAYDAVSTVTIESAPPSGSRFNLGVTDVLTTATDVAGNATTCTFTITVNDAQPPTIVCPSDITVDANLNECGQVVEFDLFASDNCGDAMISTMPENGGTFEVGMTDVLATAMDAAGNITTCTFTVTVRDVTPPTITCPVDMNVPSDDGVDGAIVDFTAEASDDCSSATVEFQPESGSLLPLGNNTVVAMATDASGNQTSCTFTVHVRDANPGLDAGWVPSGIDSGPEYLLDENSIDDVDVIHGDGALSVVVRPSVGRYRVAGWVNNAIMSRNDVLPGQFVRGKFYVTASTLADAPINEVPNFRIRLQNEGVVLASATYGYAATGSGGVSYEPFYDTVDSPDTEQFVAPSLRPSPDENRPSLYRLDFDPLDVPASMGTDIRALFESCSTQNPSDGTLMLTEVSLGVYPVPEEGETIFFWSNNPAFDQEQAGGEKGMISGKFNAEPNFEAGRRQDLELPQEDAGTPYATVIDEGQNGWVIDTDAVPQDRFGLGLLSILSDDETQVPRIEENKIYRGRFLVSSDVPTLADPNTESQGTVLLGLKTGLDGLTARLELIGPRNSVGPDLVDQELSAQVLPGIGSMIADQPSDGIIPQGEAGGWYTLQISTPLDSDITQWKDGDLSPLIDQPGPGEATVTDRLRDLPGDVSPAAPRDILAEMVAIQMPEQLKLGPDFTLPWAVPNRAKIRVIAVEIISYDQIDDGGYGY